MFGVRQPNCKFNSKENFKFHFKPLAAPIKLRILDVLSGRMSHDEVGKN